MAVLFDAGADLAAVNVYGATSLVAAVYGANPDVVQRLLAAGADPDVGNEIAREAATGMAEADWDEDACEPKKPGYAEINALLNG